MKITNQKHGMLTEPDMIALAALLLKGGYTVRKAKERPHGKETGAYVHYIEVMGGTEKGN